MDKVQRKKQRRDKIRRRIRSSIRGTKERPRMSVFKSNKHIYVQLIDDLNNHTLISASSLSNEIEDQVNDKTGVEQAQIIGKHLAEKALSANINKVVFDRGGYKYHGQIKAIAEAAREGGLQL